MVWMGRFLVRWLWPVVLVVAAVCCEDSTSRDQLDRVSGSDADADTDTDADADADADDGHGSGSKSGSECAVANATQPCCDGGGVQTCKADLTWSECDCASSDPTSSTGDDGEDPTLPSGDSNITPEGNLSTEIDFDWPETQATPGECLPGRYEGRYKGIYGFTNRKSELSGNITMTLSEEGNGEIFTITNGEFKGNARVLVPFHASITGKLDCSTARLESQIVDGEYSVVVVKQKFVGTMNADYNKDTHTLINGTWEVEVTTEDGIGGHGTWQAKLVP